MSNVIDKDNNAVVLLGFFSDQVLECNFNPPRGWMEVVPVVQGGLCTHRVNWAAGSVVAGLRAVIEASALVDGFDDLTMMGETAEQRRGHLWVAEHRGPFVQGEAGRNDDRGALVDLAHEVEQQLAPGLGEGQIVEFVEDDEVAPGELVGRAALVSGAVLGVEIVDRVNDNVAATAGALADTGPGDGDGEIGLAGPGAAESGEWRTGLFGSRRLPRLSSLA